jgi:hypothetical protein
MKTLPVEEENQEVEDLGSLPNGCHLFRRPNTAGGHVYITDEIGGGAVIWDTCIVDSSTLLVAITEESRRKYKEFHNKKKSKEIEEPYYTGQVRVGDIIFLSEEDCKAVGCIPGQYVVETSEFRGGWFVHARLLTEHGQYDPTTDDVEFHQCDGYVNSLLSVKVIGHMKKTFV